MNLHLIMPAAKQDAQLIPRALRSVGKAFELARGHLVFDSIERFFVHVVTDGWSAGTMEAEFQNWILRRRRIHPADKPFPDTPHGIYVHELAESHGPAIARNLVLAQLEPEDLVMFLDADDELSGTGILERLMLCIRYGGEPESKPFVYSSILVDDEKLRKSHPGLMTMRQPISPDILKEVILGNNALIPLQVMTTAGLLQEAGGFEPYLICGEDGNLWRRVIQFLNPIIAATPGPCGIYRWRYASQSKALHHFHEKAFHLDKQKYGPMGQALDDGMDSRCADLKKAITVSEKVKALTDGVLASDLKSYVSEEVTA